MTESQKWLEHTCFRRREKPGVARSVTELSQSRHGPWEREMVLGLRPQMLSKQREIQQQAEGNPAECLTVPEKEVGV